MQLKQSGYKQVNDIQLYYEIHGEGKPLVLIHGGGSSHCFDFGHIIPLLSDTFMLISVDLQNHGRSQHRNIPQTFEQDADDVINVLNQLDIGKASFWGFSNGGNTVMQIAHRYPEKAEKLIVASSFFQREGLFDGFYEGLTNATIDHMPQYLKDNFLKLNPDKDALQNSFEKDRDRMLKFQNWDESILTSMQVPVLFIAGDLDVAKPEHTVHMWRLVPDSRLMLLPTTHGPYMMADENGNLDKELIQFTTGQIKKFLSVG